MNQSIQRSEDALKANPQNAVARANLTTQQRLLPGLNQSIKLLTWNVHITPATRH